MMQKVVITGASGLLGRSLLAEYKRLEWNVLGFANSRVKDGLIKVDLTDPLATASAIMDFMPSVIVHAAAERSPDKVEKNVDSCKVLNVGASKSIAELAAKNNMLLIFISTDYVFEGNRKEYAYTEEDLPNPVNQYGKTKFEAEQEIHKVNKNAIVLRIPVLYGGEEYIGESAVSSLLNFLKDTTPAKVSNLEERFPCHVNDIASICVQLSAEWLKNKKLHSVYHWCGNAKYTKYEMLKIMAQEFHLLCSHIIPDENPVSSVPRPLYVKLDCGRLNALGIGKYTPFQEGIKEYKKFL